MRITRRQLVATLSRLPVAISAACFGIYTRLAPAQATSASLNPEQMAKLERIAWLLFPITDLDEGPYQRTAAGIAAQTAAQPEQFEMLKLGLDELDGDGAFLELSESEQINHLRRIEQGPLFQYLFPAVRSRLWDDRAVWARIGYEGSSLAKGGYINRGLADIDWL